MPGLLTEGNGYWVEKTGALYKKSNDNEARLLYGVKNKYCYQKLPRVASS